MRFVIYGAGAIGGALGVSLTESGHDVVLIARGAQLEAIRSSGLTLESPDRIVTLRLPVVDHPSEIDFADGDVVLLTVKGQDSEVALRTLATAAPTTVPVVCMQNGVENERIAVRRFANVYGALVLAPAEFLSPGLVVVAAAPNYGLADVGRYPSGSDHVSEALAEALTRSHWASRSVDNIMAWKFTKLLNNLSNAAQVVVGQMAHGSEIATRAKAEGIVALDRAGISYVRREEMEARRSEAIVERPVPGHERVGSSTWQSIIRGTGNVESDYMNGEIVRIAREHGGDAPLNALLQRLSNEIARSLGEMGPMDEKAFLQLLGEG